MEDEPSVLGLARRILTRIGYEVLAADSGAHALERASEHPGVIDLLLTDVMMPGVNGKELADRLALSRPGLRVLYMSGYSADIVAPEGVLTASTHFLAKPFSPTSLTAKVEEVLRPQTRA
ncbi:MAG: response regulator [Thermoleophilia bacterium]